MAPPGTSLRFVPSGDAEPQQLRAATTVPSQLRDWRGASWFYQFGALYATSCGRVLRHADDIRIAR